MFRCPGTQEEKIMSTRLSFIHIFHNIHIIVVSILFLAILTGCGQSSNDLTQWVDPFIGTGGHGHTYPGAALPFGMVQLSPDTRVEGWDSCSGYHYSDNVIYGFSHTHLSGTGVPDYNDILLMPTVGDVKWKNDDPDNPAPGYLSSFSHQNENAAPGYYKVQLSTYNITAELTATARTGIHRYTFPTGSKANIVIDLTHRDTVLDSGITFTSHNEIEGFRRSRSWARNQHLFFVARFSVPYDTHTVAIADVQRSPSTDKNDSYRGQNIKSFVTFNNPPAEPIVVKVGISAVSIEGARKNLDAETTGRSFLQIKSDARNSWNNALGKIKINGGSTPQRRIFYTALYHALLTPNLFTDADGNYRGRDLEIHRADGFTNYTVFSLWDTYRTLHPLFTIIEPERTNDFIKTFIAQFKQGGLLPVWELAANETFCMIGYHSVSVIADAYIKGLTDCDAETVYQAALHSANQDHHGLNYYKKMGFIPSEGDAESVSKTLEYAYDDWCIAQLADALGKKDDYNRFIQRAQYYKNIFDPSTGFMRAKLRGRWFEPFNPAEVNFNYTEANSWQYSFYVPQDVSGLIRLMGGKDKFAAKLDALFNADSNTSGHALPDISGLIGQYAHGNEPSHHMAYLYNYANQPWKTQQRVRQIMDTLYTDKPDGLSGNEDCGQMSAWFILSALGFYPVTPGSDVYVIGTPLFPEASIGLGNGKAFTVKATNVSDKNIYIQSATLNGQPLQKSFVRHADIMKGGTLTFTMGPEPNKEWAASDNDIPVSEITDHLILPVPYIKEGSRTFTTETRVALACITPGARIHYTLDGSIPTPQSTLYTEPLTVTRSMTINSIAVKDGSPPSPVLSAQFDKIPSGRTIKLNSQYAPPYSAGGNNALIDGIRGSGDHRTGTWQGYEQVDIDAVIDLGNVQAINQISTGFLQDINSWIFMPLHVQYSISTNGKDFKTIARIDNSIPLNKDGRITKNFTASFKTHNARFIKIHAKNTGTCPPWHKGAGGKAWIFADEIVIY
jgi:predicted alpha-1,2-mannosidase